MKSLLRLARSLTIFSSCKRKKNIKIEVFVTLQAFFIFFVDKYQKSNFGGWKNILNLADFGSF